jgi:predicted NBD/HSP70 family sugar kinase
MDEQEKRARAFVRRVFAGATKSVTKEGAQQFFRAGIELKPIEELIEGAREGDPKALEVLRARTRPARQRCDGTERISSICLGMFP